MADYDVSIKKVTLWLSLILVALTAVHVLTWYLNFYTGLDAHPWFRIFDVDEEANIPTYFNALLLLAPSILLLLIGSRGARERAPYFKHWLAMGFIFLFLSIDESAMIHEEFVEPMRRLFDIDGGFFYPAWVIFYSILTIVFFLFFLRFLGHLPRRIMWLFLIAGAVYVGGAVGFEMLQGYLTTHYPEAGVLRRVVTILEEFFEMAGLIIFIKGLLEYIMMKLDRFNFRVVP